MKVKYLPINKAFIKMRPDRFNIEINGVELIFEVSWNTKGGFFSFDLCNSDEEPILHGKRIVYGVDMLDNILNDLLAGVKIIPFDKTGHAEVTRITFDNFMESVKPYIVGDR